MGKKIFNSVYSTMETTARIIPRQRDFQQEKSKSSNSTLVVFLIEEQQGAKQATTKDCDRTQITMLVMKAVYALFNRFIICLRREMITNFSPLLVCPYSKLKVLLTWREPTKFILIAFLQLRKLIE